MSFMINAITPEAAHNNTLLINPLALGAILLLLFLLGWKEKLRLAETEANQRTMALLNVVILPLGCIFVGTILMRVLTFIR